MPKTLLKRAPLLLLLPLLLVACSSGPSDSEIEAAVKQSLEKSIPVQLSRHMGGGSEGEVQDFRIIEVGSVQGEGSREYWPVKIYTRGRCKVGVMQFKKMAGFEGETVYNLSKDAFGKWNADHDGF